MSAQRVRKRLAQMTLAACLGTALVSCGSGGRPDASPPTTDRAGVAALPTTTTIGSAPPTTSTPSTTTSTTASTAPGIEVGPGPQSQYTVQAQPPAGTCHYRASGAFELPDPRCTPGAVNPQVTQGDISSTICVSGYTSSIRPPESVTEPEKVASAAAYGYTGSFHTAEYDHLIPLELGGDPNDPANLWVEPNDRPDATDTYNSKDVLESRLKDLVCSGRLTLAAAQQAIATDWVAAYRTYS